MLSYQDTMITVLDGKIVLFAVLVELLRNTL